MTCEQCQDHMTFFLTHQLSRAEEEEFRSHVNICEACRRELDEAEHFARAVHNVSVPFRQSTALIENRMREPIELGFWHNVLWHWVPGAGERRRKFLLPAGIALVCMAFFLIILLTRTDSKADPVARWAIQHYSLIDQTHPLQGNADTVRTWFRSHHQVEIVPPQRVDYTGLVGCKMIEWDSEPAPLLRFAGPQPSAVFILPARYGNILPSGREIGLEMDGYRVHLWIEGNHPYVRISKSS